MTKLSILFSCVLSIAFALGQAWAEPEISNRTICAIDGISVENIHIAHKDHSPLWAKHDLMDIAGAVRVGTCDYNDRDIAVAAELKDGRKVAYIFRYGLNR